MQNASEYLLSNGIKPSVQRVAVMDYLLANRTHPTVDEIYSALVPTMPTLSRTTIYNTLQLFAERGVAQCLSIDEKQQHFDGDTSDHVHLQCTTCGEIFDVYSSEFPASAALFVDQIGDFKIESTHIYYKGICQRCASGNKN